MTGATIDFMASSESIPTDLGTDVEILLRAGGVWYVSDSVVNIKDDVANTKKPYSFDPAASTWMALDAATNTNLDLLAGNDEIPLGLLAAGVPDLSDVTGGGFRGASDPGNNDDVKIDDIVWDQNPLLNAPPDPRIGINQKKNVTATPYVYNMPQSVNGSFVDDDNKPGPAVPSWALTSATSAIPEPVFWKTDGIGGPRYDASDTVDPNIDLPVGIFVMHLEGYDGDLYADPNATATRTVVNNKVFKNLEASVSPQSTALSAGGTVTVTGSYTTPDDDIGGEQSVVTTTWYLEDGPAGGAVAFGDKNALVTSAKFSGATGDYTLRLEAHEDAMGITEAKDANELVSVTVDEYQLKLLDAELTDDTFTRGGSNEDDVNGADNEMDSREGTNAKLRRSYVKFDTSAVSGSVLSATFSAVPYSNATFDSAIYATTYGDGGEWFEHELSDANNVLVKGAVVATQAGPQVQKERVEYALSDLVRTPDGKTTLQLVLVDSNLNKGWYTKEKGDYIPMLSVLYDPNGMYDPSPADGALGVDPLLAELSWKAQKGNNFEVFFGPSAGAIVSIGTAAPIGDTVTFPFTAGPLATSTSYTWYVIGDDGATPGDEWTFDSVDLPISVAPADGAEVTPGDALEDSITWTGANTATSANLYLSQDEEDVNSMSSSALIAGIANGHRLENLILAGDVDYGGSVPTYYWKVEAIMPSGNMTTGVSSFTVDIKSKFGGFSDLTGSSPIVGENATWTASGSNTTDTTVVIVDTVIDKEPAKSGQGLKLIYNEANGQTAVTATFNYIQDWTVAGTNSAALKFDYIGDDENVDPGVVTITLLDASDVNAVLTLTYGEGELEYLPGAMWTDIETANISLGDFVADASFDMSAIKSFTVSIGDGEGTESGAIYFDLFQIYSERCLTGEVDYYFNNSDCLADVNEVIEMAEWWLTAYDETPVTVTGAAPGTNPVIHFDYDVYDDVDRKFVGVYGHETARTGGANPVHVTEVNDLATLPGGAVNLGCMRVHGNQATDTKMETTSFLFTPTNNGSVSVWLNGDTITGADMRKTGGQVKTQRPLELKANGSGTWWKLEVPEKKGRIQAAGAGIKGVGTVVHRSVFEGNWTHVAYVHDYDNNRSSIFVNGVLTEQTEAPDPFPATIVHLRIPDTANKSHENSYYGRIDEFQVYNYALSHENVVYLSNNTDVVSPREATEDDTPGKGELTGDSKWDLADLAALSENYQKAPVLFP
ncbi:MAG: LamG domain-containing protein [Planctomycetes bacterium]|nr:LamG domain-containing protein [Planctomycetota bacterium]